MSETPTQYTAEGHAWKSIDPTPGHTGYPKQDAHTWGCFAGLAVELGGYGDLELIDPYTGSRFWFQPQGNRSSLDRAPFDFPEALMQALQAAKAAGWWDLITTRAESGE